MTGTSWSVIDRCDIWSNFSIMSDNFIKSLGFQLDILFYRTVSKVGGFYCIKLSDLLMNTPIDESVLRLVLKYSITSFIRASRDLTIILGYTYVRIKQFDHFNVF